MEQSDQEIKKRYVISPIQDDDIVRVTFTSETVPTPEGRFRMGELMFKDMMDLYSQHKDRKFRILYDIQKLHTEEKSIPSKLKEMYAEILKHPQTQKIAVMGRDGDQNRAAQLVLGFYNIFSSTKIGWFIRPDEAETWLNKK